MQEWKSREQIAGLENAGVGLLYGKPKAERRLFRETALNYLLKIVCRFLTEYSVIFFHCSSLYIQGCRGYGNSHGDSHGYGYGMGMGTMMNPHGPVGILCGF